MRPQIESRVFFRAMRVTGQDRVVGCSFLKIRIFMNFDGLSEPAIDNRLSLPKSPRVLAVAPMPPEKSAYALARYQPRSPRIPFATRSSWVRTHDSAVKFLENFYFQYGHASIADLGHVMLCFEGVSELAATEIEDEQLWDGQAR